MELIGSPFDLCGYRRGSRLGPPAIRQAGLVEALTGLGLTIHDLGDGDAPNNEDDRGLKHFGPLLDNTKWLSAKLKKSFAKKEVPLVIGGDHTAGAITVGTANKHFDGDLAVLWIDAHTDLNTPASSPSGNIHGMPMGACLGLSSGVKGLKDEQWKEWQSYVASPPLDAHRVGWLGLRDVDPGEREVLRQLKGSFVATMYDIDRHGLVLMLDRFDEWVRETGVRKLWISFDVDVLDPILAPGTGTAVRGGLSYREMHLMAEMLYEFLEDKVYSLAGMDIVEINPLFDTNNETARAAVEWIASLFGKTILGKR